MKNVDNSMNIRTQNAGLSRASSQQAGRAGERPSGGTPPVSGTNAVSNDTVTLTSSAEEMLKLERSLAAIPDIDHSRVSSIKASIADGTYQVDPDKIVNKLLSIEQDLR